IKMLSDSAVNPKNTDSTGSKLILTFQRMSKWALKVCLQTSKQIILKNKLSIKKKRLKTTIKTICDALAQAYPLQ
ncbi:hypothetical protein BB561_006166, partial [Smittium simulii]